MFSKESLKRNLASRLTRAARNEYGEPKWPYGEKCLGPIDEFLSELAGEIGVQLDKLVDDANEERQSTSLRPIVYPSERLVKQALQKVLRDEELMARWRHTNGLTTSYTAKPSRTRPEGGKIPAK